MLTIRKIASLRVEISGSQESRPRELNTHRIFQVGEEGN